MKVKRLVFKSVRTLSVRATTRQPSRPPMSRNQNVRKRISPLLSSTLTLKSLGWFYKRGWFYKASSVAVRY